MQWTLSFLTMIFLGLTATADGTWSPAICVKNCTARSLSGTCLEYGTDYCGINAQCVPQCTSRSLSSTCMEYGADFCGTNAECSINCISRWPSGTCGQYGPDACNAGQ